MEINKTNEQKPQKIRELWERMQNNKNIEINKVHHIVSILLLKLLTQVHWKIIF